MPANRNSTAAGIPDLSSYKAPRKGRGNAVNETTHAIREAILDGVLNPQAWLREESLAADLGVSRTPVREALNRLEEEGLIERGPGFGARVTALTIEDMSVVYMVRGSLESLAARAAAERGNSASLSELRCIHERMVNVVEQDDTQAVSRVNIEFHRELASITQNAYLIRLLGTVESALRRFGSRSYSTERMHEILGEHERMLVAIENGDGAAAAEAAEKHAQRARVVTIGNLIGDVRR